MHKMINGKLAVCLPKEESQIHAEWAESERLLREEDARETAPAPDAPLRNLQAEIDVLTTRLENLERGIR